ncbi:DUF2992 family protein [Brevibacillus laterosporus]|nr:DUF2992 family protein [Brevibacillus laterosporus]TPG92077.1 DUF2992 family protein [Brevibacillus laterosporus]
MKLTVMYDLLRKNEGSAEQAIQQDLEKRKKERKVLSKERKEEIAEYKREVARRKAKEKHRDH